MAIFFNLIQLLAAYFIFFKETWNNFIKKQKQYEFEIIQKKIGLIISIYQSKNYWSWWKILVSFY